VSFLTRPEHQFHKRILLTNKFTTRTANYQNRDLICLESKVCCKSKNRPLKRTVDNLFHAIIILGWNLLIKKDTKLRP